AKLLAGRPSPRAAYCRCVALLRASDRDGYRALCRQFGQAAPTIPYPQVLAELAWCFALGTDAAEDWNVPLRCIDAALEALRRSGADNPDLLHAWRNT